MFNSKFYFYLVISLFISGKLLAQNTSSVFSPTFKKDHRSVEYRMAHDIKSHALGTRLHYQEALNEKYRARIQLKTKKTSDHNFDLYYGRLQLLQRLTLGDDKYQSALRYEATFATNNNPNEFAIGFTNQYQFNDKLSSRLILMTAREFGENQNPYFALESRASVKYKFNSRFSTGLEMFNEYGSTKEVPTFADQDHQIGPFISSKINKNFNIVTGFLLGMTNASPDQEVRVFIKNSF